MSITFYVAVEDHRGYIVPAEGCDCSRRWCDDCDTADEKGEEWPEQYSCDVCLVGEMNLANGNALDLLAWVGLTVDYAGHVSARELAPKVRRRLWDVDRNHDEGITPTSEGRVHYGGRAPGYLRERCERLLAICERAGDRLVAWA
jgi:hypothetical protein